MARVLRPYHYLTAAKEDREDPHLVRERVKCGKPSCRCAQDVRHRHGPYIYLRYEEFGRRTGQICYRREYARATSTRRRALMAFLRRYVRGMVHRERRRARMRAAQRS
jgi:hypothetical protein